MACWDSFPKTYHVEVDYRKLLHKVFLDVIRTHNEYYESAVDISGERLYVGHSLIKHNTSMACNKHTEHIREKAEERLYIFNVKTGLPPHQSSDFQPFLSSMWRSRQWAGYPPGDSSSAEKTFSAF